MKKETNIQFCLLSALGIIFVVDGHLNHSFFDIGGLLPYYSFHMPLFVFISGYFFNQKDGENLWEFGKRKFIHLMIPYYFWNLAYGIMAAFLRSQGFLFGEAVTLENLLIEPFCMGYQFILNHAAWFVPTLFLIEVSYNSFESIFSIGSGEGCKVRNNDKRAAVLFLMLLPVGIGGICLSRSRGTEGFLLTLEKLLFLLPFYASGVWYRRSGENKDCLNNGIYFSIVLGAFLCLWLSGKSLIYSVSTCRDFTGYLLPYITGFLGIAFWLRVSRILAPAFQDSKFLEFFGRNTFSIMMHHMMVFFAITSFFAFGAKYLGLFPDFDFARYKSDIYYCYRPRGDGQWIMVYLLAGILLPLLWKWVVGQFQKRWNPCKMVQ